MSELDQFLEQLGAISSEYMIPDRASEMKAKMDTIVDCLLQQVTTGRTENFDGLFQVIEHHLVFGSQELRNTILVHLLEELKNQASYRDLDFAVFEPWLGAETYVAWRWLEKRWRAKESLAQAAKKEEK